MGVPSKQNVFVCKQKPLFKEVRGWVCRSFRVAEHTLPAMIEVANQATNRSTNFSPKTSCFNSKMKLKPGSTPICETFVFMPFRPPKRNGMFFFLARHNKTRWFLLPASQLSTQRKRPTSALQTAAQSLPAGKGCHRGERRWGVFRVGVIWFLCHSWEVWKAKLRFVQVRLAFGRLVGDVCCRVY